MSTRTIDSRVDTPHIPHEAGVCDTSPASRVWHSSPLPVWSGVRKGTSAHLQERVARASPRAFPDPHAHSASAKKPEPEFPFSPPGTREHARGCLLPVEGELKGLIVALTHWVSTSGRLPCTQFTCEHSQYISSTFLLPIFKLEIRVDIKPTSNDAEN